MGAYSGTVIRPSTGRSVFWTLAPVLAGLGRQLDELGITWYSIGNADHLDNIPPGGHTPWKPGAPAGMVTAIDVMKAPYADVERRILKFLRDPTYPTTFIDFINVNYTQYDFDGREQGDSGDGHLHLEGLGNKVGATSTLFRDMWAPAKPSPVPHPATTTKGEPMFALVKLRNDARVFKAENSVLQHLTAKQYQSAQVFLKATGQRVDEFVVADEEELATYGTVVEKQNTKVEGL